MGAATVVVALSQIVSQIGVGPAIIQRRELLPDPHPRGGDPVLRSGPAARRGRVLRRPGDRPVLSNSGGRARTARGGVPVPAGRPEHRRQVAAQPRPQVPPVRRAGCGQLHRRIRAASASCWLGSATACGPWWRPSSSQSALRAVVMYLATRHSIRPSFNLQASRDLLSFGFGPLDRADRHGSLPAGRQPRGRPVARPGGARYLWACIQPDGHAGIRVRQDRESGTLPGHVAGAGRTRASRRRLRARARHRRAWSRCRSAPSCGSSRRS